MTFRTAFLLSFLSIAATFIATGKAEETYWVCCESGGGGPSCKKVTGSLSTNYDCTEKSVPGRVNNGKQEYSLEKTFLGTGASNRVSIKIAACDDENTFQVTKSNDALKYQCDKGYEALVVKFDSDYY